jgi:hypothetical protein
MNDDKKTLINKLKTAAEVSQFMADYYLELDQASRNGKPKIAWCTSPGTGNRKSPGAPASVLLKF